VLAFDADVRNLVPEQVLIALKNKSKGREWWLKWNLLNY
jgi:hypothetical protein